MHRCTAARLLRLNREFYDRFATEFSDSRSVLSPGILRALDLFQDCRSLLDLGCGNGRIGRALVTNVVPNRVERYVGVDFSAGLLGQQGASATDPDPCTPGHSPSMPPETPNRRFDLVRADLSSSGWTAVLGEDPFDAITCFATLFHIPGARRRARLMRDMKARLTPTGIAVISVWRFLHVPRLTKKIIPWPEIGLADSAVDPGDHLLDWRRGGQGLRYVHHFDETELRNLCVRAGFRIDHEYRSDGQTGDMSWFLVLRS